MSKLSVFDFDGTIFRSPSQPFWYRGNSWWGDPISLNPPVVPERPNDEYWVTDTVSKAKLEINKNDTLAVLITGRRNKFFSYRVQELIKQKELKFDAVYFSEDDNEMFKIGVINSILRKHNFDEIEFWDDNSRLLNEYVSYYKKTGLVVNKNLVKVNPVDVSEIDPSEIPGPQFGTKLIYSAIVVKDDNSLINWWKSNIGDILDDVYCDHITLSFRNPEKFYNFLGKEVKFKINSYVNDKDIQAVGVEILDGSIVCDNEHPHITISIRKNSGKFPKHSNDAMKNSLPISGPTMDGIIGVSDSKRFYFKTDDFGEMPKKYASLLNRYYRLIT